MLEFDKGCTFSYELKTSREVGILLYYHTNTRRYEMVADINAWFSIYVHAQTQKI